MSYPRLKKISYKQNEDDDDGGVEDDAGGCDGDDNEDKLIWSKTSQTKESSSTLAYSINKEHLATKCHSSDINLSGFYLVLQVCF